MTTTTTAQALAQEALDAMERATRPNGDEFDRFRDDAPAWTKDLSYAAHEDASAAPGSMFRHHLPDDHRYEFIRDALAAIADHDDLDDAADELEPDVYTHDLTRWLDSSLTRQGYVDEVMDELGGDVRDTAQLLALGQLAERREVFDAVRQFLENAADDDDDADQDEDDDDA